MHGGSLCNGHLKTAGLAEMEIQTEIFVFSSHVLQMLIVIFGTHCTDGIVLTSWKRDRLMGEKELQENLRDIES